MSARLRVTASQYAQQWLAGGESRRQVLKLILCNDPANAAAIAVIASGLLQSPLGIGDCGFTDALLKEATRYDVADPQEKVE